MNQASTCQPARDEQDNDPAPIRPAARDGIYPRCVHCNGENWALAVIAYSTGKAPCAAVPGCGRYIPDSYIGRNDRHIRELAES